MRQRVAGAPADVGQRQASRPEWTEFDPWFPWKLTRNLGNPHFCGGLKCLISPLGPDLGSVLHCAVLADLPSRHLPRRPNRQPQHFAQRRQVRIAWASAIGLPEVDARRADTYLVSDLNNR